MQSSTHHLFKLSALFVSLSTLSLNALASGYHFGAQSASALSTANANEAEAANASTIFHNPAGLTNLPGAQVSGNLIFVVPSVKHKNAQGHYANGTAIPGSHSGDIVKDLVVVPQLYGSYQINDRLTAGLGLYIPFATETEYDRDSVMRYNVNKTKLTTFNINPTLAFKLNEQHSFGVGIIAQYATAELRQYAEFSPLARAAMKVKGVPDAQIALAKPGTADGYAELKGNDWGFGYNLGWLWDINDDVRMGLSYRSKVKHTLKGTGKWHTEGPYANASSAFIQAPFALIEHPSSPDPIPTGAGYVPSEPITAKITTPDSLSLHGMWKVDPKWNVFGNLTWTRHSYFNNLTINWENRKIIANANGNPDEPKSLVTVGQGTILKPHWRNTWKVALGTSYQITEPLQLRAGISYDQSPVRSADYRITTMPDNNRIMLGLGAKYDINKNNTLDLAYAYMHIKNAKVNANGYCGSEASTGPMSASCVSSRTTATASYKSNAHLLGLQYTYKF